VKGMTKTAGVNKLRACGVQELGRTADSRAKALSERAIKDLDARVVV